MEKIIFLDNHSTTKIDDRVLQEILPFYTEIYSNPSSKENYFGRFAFESVNNARGKVANLINSDADEIIFTSCATESNNLVLKGIAENNYKKGKHIISVATEHSSVINVLSKLEKYGFEITILNVDEFGNINLDELTNSIRQDTILVSVMMANNEIGTIHQVEEISNICLKRNIPFHTDASQAGAYLSIDIKKMNPSFLTLSSHKMYGPKGIAALFCNKKQNLEFNSQIDGGGQENKIRSGTLNVPAIIGFGKACEIAKNEMKNYTNQIFELRNLFQTSLEKIQDIKVNGNQNLRLPNNLNLTIDGVKGIELIKNSGNIIFSTNSACLNENENNYSHVLKSIGLSKKESDSTVRFGLSKFTTKDEINFAIENITNKIKELRKNKLTIKL